MSDRDLGQAVGPKGTRGCQVTNMSHLYALHRLSGAETLACRLPGTADSARDAIYRYKLRDDDSHAPCTSFHRGASERGRSGRQDAMIHPGEPPRAAPRRCWMLCDHAAEMTSDLH